MQAAFREHLKKVKAVDFELAKKLGHWMPLSFVYDQPPLAKPAEHDLKHNISHWKVSRRALRFAKEYIKKKYFKYLAWSP